MRVLIAEDDPVSRLMLVAILRKWGHEPMVACDGLEALSYFKNIPPPDLAFLDWMMPEMDGPAICRAIRKEFPAMPIYIILLTAKSQHEDLVAGLASGADDYVAKPFNQSELRARFEAGRRIVNLQRSLAERVQELGIALSRLRLMQQSQKLEALGQMASGIAHEINTPTQYVGENIHFVRDSWNQIQPILEQESRNSDIAYLSNEVPKAIDESLQGIQKISKIVRAIRDFSAPLSECKVSININRAIESAVTVAASHWRYIADLTTNLDETIPEVLCFPGEIHQVIFNIIVNASDSIADANASSSHRGAIRIVTTASNGWVEIRISDTGTGIAEENRSHIFEPFFTTKGIGQGVGLGLATAYATIVQQHSGKLSFETETHQGTTFLVRIPINGIGEDRHEHEASSVR